MRTALIRKLRADFRTNRLQYSLITGVLALSAMLLALSLLVMRSADQPWERTFEETNGPHVWIVSNQYDLDIRPLEMNPEVTETTGLMMALSDSPIILDGTKVPMFLYAMDQPPAVAHPLLAEGRWLNQANPDEIVLDYSLARYYELRVGDQVEVLGNPDIHRLEIVGLAVTAHWFPYDDITKDIAPAVGYISQSTLTDLQPDSHFWYGAIGLRLAHPEQSKQFVQQLYQIYPRQLQSVLEWQWVQENATLANTLNVTFMGLFSILGLIAVGLIIFNTIGGQILSQYRDIGLLKAIGLTPGQVTGLFLFEHLVLGMIAAVLGIAAGIIVAPAIVSPLAENLNTIAPKVLDPALMLFVFVTVEAAVLLATLLPAWRGGGIDTIQAITVGYRRGHNRPSLLARMATGLRLPIVIVLGVKDTFSRPLRSNMAILGIAMTSIIAIMAVQANATASELSRDKVYFNGTSAQARIRRHFVPHTTIETEILDSPSVESSYGELSLFGTSPENIDQPIFFRFITEGYQTFDFQLKEGRMFENPGEAIAVYGALETLNAQIGDIVEVIVDGAPVQLTIVGRYIEGFNTGNVIISSLDTYQQQVDPQALPLIYYLNFTPQSPRDELLKRWRDQFEGVVDVEYVSEEPQSSLSQFVALLTVLGMIMTLVTIVNLMSTCVLSIRERVRDFGIQKSVGVTPTQIAVGVATGTILIAILGLVVGTFIGVTFMSDFIGNVGILLGIGTDFYSLKWSWIAGLIPFMALVAVLSSLWPAIRAARLQVVEALHYE
ncbi:MAG: FtsX-like permease family protein [Anaerolineales bacterium]|jgi:putative ABC transport system permease protein